MKKNRIMKSILIISILIFAVSLTQKTYCLDGLCGYRGISDLLIGWLGVWYGKIGSTAWLANPFLLTAWIFLMRKPKLALLFSILSFGFAFHFYFQDSMIKNEAGHIGKITAYKTGYWLWLASIIMIFIGSVIGVLKSN